MISNNHNILINDIFNYLEPKNISIRRLDNPSLIKDVTYSSYVILQYNKPRDKITSKEWEILNNAKGAFHCSENMIRNEVYSSCPMLFTIHLTPIVKPENQVLQHTFSQPKQLDFYTEYTKTKLKPSIVLLPLAMAIDVVTFPIQIYHSLDNWKY